MIIIDQPNKEICRKQFQRYEGLFSHATKASPFLLAIAKHSTGSERLLLSLVLYIISHHLLRLAQPKFVTKPSRDPEPISTLLLKGGRARVTQVGIGGAVDGI